MPFAEQFGCKSCSHLYPRKLKLICDSFCEILGSVWKLQKIEKTWRGSCIRTESAVVHEVVPAEKLDLERVFDREIRYNDRYFIKTVFKWKDSGGLVINPSIILFGNISRVFHNIECANYEWPWSFISGWHASIMDWQKTLQYRLVTAFNDVINVHKEIIQISFKRLLKIHKHILVQDNDQQDCPIHSWKVV